MAWRLVALPRAEAQQAEPPGPFPCVTLGASAASCEVGSNSILGEPMTLDPSAATQMAAPEVSEPVSSLARQKQAAADTLADRPSATRRADTKELHIRVPIQNYQYLDRLACRYGMRSLASAVNFLIEYHRRTESETAQYGVRPAAKVVR